jgi:flagellin
MGLVVNTNVSSLNAQRNLFHSTGRLNKSFQRLSSGLRINSAGDDAAGLAISERFTTQIRGLSQAIRNANDAISLAQVAEGALQESTNVIQRMRELAVQAGNDTNTDQDRRAIQDEIDQLVLELDRIGNTTRFNSKVLLDGSFLDAYFHVGAYFQETVRVQIRDARAITVGRQATFTGNNVSLNPLAAGDLTINGVAIRATQPVDDTLSTAAADASAIAKARAINDSTANTGVTAKVLPNQFTAPNAITGGALNGADNIVINGVIITGFTVAADDADGALMKAINEEFSRTGVRAFLDVNHNLTLRAEDGRNIDVVVNGAAGAIVGIPASVTQTAAINLYSENQIQLGGANEAFVGFANNQLVGVTTVEAVSTADVLTRQAANDTLLKLDRALGQLASDRAGLGAFINRLQSTVSNLTNTVENSSSAKSRIMDTDFASETSELTKYQIVQQAGISVLSQANSSPQQILSLLQGN